MQKTNKKILIITTNVSQSPDMKLNQTGVWLEEFAVPYLIFRATGYEITVASPLGGLSPVDEDSMSCSNPVEWDDCIKILRNTTVLSETNYKEYEALFLPGGHGPMFDLANNLLLKEILEYFHCENKLISAICHGPAGLLQAKDKNGESILRGKNVTCFSSKEEQIVHKTELVPFLLEDKIRELGANVLTAPPWSEHVCIDGTLITGQNPQSSMLLAEKIVDNLNK